MPRLVVQAEQAPGPVAVHLRSTCPQHSCLLLCTWCVCCAGPKTLCNACGVKLVRANAKHKDNPRRRAAAKAGAGGDAKLGAAGAAAAVSPARAAPLPKQSSGSLTSDSGAPRAPDLAPSPVLRRPQRKARRALQARRWSAKSLRTL